MRVAFDIPADARQLTKLEAGGEAAMFQPVTRGEMSEMFGREISRDLIAGLREEGPIAAGARSPKVGATYAYVTTQKFLIEFGVESSRPAGSSETRRTRAFSVRKPGAARTSGPRPAKRGGRNLPRGASRLADLAGVLGLEAEDDESDEDVA